MCWLHGGMAGKLAGRVEGGTWRTGNAEGETGMPQWKGENVEVKEFPELSSDMDCSPLPSSKGPGCNRQMKFSQSVKSPVHSYCISRNSRKAVSQVFPCFLSDVKDHQLWHVCAMTTL